MGVTGCSRLTAGASAQGRSRCADVRAFPQARHRLVSVYHRASAAPSCSRVCPALPRMLQLDPCASLRVAAAADAAAERDGIERALVLWNRALGAHLSTTDHGLYDDQRGIVFINRDLVDGLSTAGSQPPRRADFLTRHCEPIARRGGAARNSFRTESGDPVRRVQLVCTGIACPRAQFLIGGRHGRADLADSRGGPSRRGAARVVPHRVPRGEQSMRQAGMRVARIHDQRRSQP